MNKTEHARKSVAAILLSGVALFLLYLALPLLRGTVYTEDDLGAFHLPLRAFYQQCLVNGESFLWTPYIFNGFYLLGEGQLGMLHPLHWGLYRFLPLETAFTLELWLSFPVALLGMWCLLRRWELSAVAAIFGAFGFAFVGFNLNHYVHMHFVATLAHLPWAWYAIDCLLRPRGESRRLAGPLLLLFMLSLSQLLKAMPQVIVFSWMAEGLYAALLLVVAARRPIIPQGRLLLLAALLLAVKALAIGAAGAQLLPLWEGLQSSYRADPGEEFRQSISLHPWNLVQFVNPYLFQRRVYAPFSGDEPWDAIYFGAAAPALLLVLAMRWRQLGAMRLLAGFGLALAGFGLLAALGRYGVVHYVLDAIPVLDKLRAPARYVALFHAGLTLAVAVGFGALLGRGMNASCPPSKGVPKGRGMWGAGDDVGETSSPGSTSPLIPLQRGTETPEPEGEDSAACSRTAISDEGGVGETPMPGSTSPLIPLQRGTETRVVENAAVAACLSVSEASGERKHLDFLLLSPAVLAVLSLLVPLALSKPHLAMPYSSVLLGAMLVGVGSVLVWACARGVRLAPVLLAVFVLCDAGVYGLRHKPTQSLDAYLAGIPPPPRPVGMRLDTDIHPTFLNRYGMLGYRVVYGYTALMPDRALDYTQEVPLRVAGVQWREARHAASPELAAAKDQGATWRPMPGAMPRYRLTPEPDSMQILGGEVQVVHEAPGYLRLRVHAPPHAWVFAAESFHPGWRATIDGEAVAIMQAHSDFMAVPVTGGKHVVEFRFEPQSYAQGRTMSYASLGISALFFLMLFYFGGCGRRA